MGLIQHGWCSDKKTETWRQSLVMTQEEGGRVETETEIGVMLPQAKGPWGPQELEE